MADSRWPSSVTRTSTTLRSEHTSSSYRKGQLPDHRDRLEFIEPGAAQHFADNVLGVLDHLLSPESPLLSDQPWSPPNMVYLSLYDRFFFTWSLEAATKVYIGMAAVSATLILTRVVEWIKWKVFIVAIVGNALGVVAGLVSANLVAGVMFFTKHRMAW